MYNMQGFSSENLMLTIYSSMSKIQEKYVLTVRRLKVSCYILGENLYFT